MIIKLIVVISLCLVIQSQQCEGPLIIDQLQGFSLFQLTRELPEVLQQMFAPPLDPIIYSEKKSTLTKSSYTLSNIIVNWFYKNGNEQIRLGDSQILKDGGQLQIWVTMNFEFKSSQNGVFRRSGKGKAVSRLPGDLPINLTKSPQMIETTLHWISEVVPIVIQNLTFTVTQGDSKLKPQDEANFLMMVNNDTSDFFSVRTQLITRLKSITFEVNTWNDNLVPQYFPSVSLYSFQQKPISYDDSLNDYRITVSDQIRSHRGLINSVNSSSDYNHDCEVVEILKEKESYILVSNSFINNTFDYLRQNKFLDVKINNKTWPLPGIPYTMKELSLIIPAILNDYSPDDPVEIQCNFIDGPPPGPQKSLNIYNSDIIYNCSVIAPTNKATIALFNVNATFNFNFTFADSSEIIFYISKSVFLGYQFQALNGYTIERPQLAAYSVSEAGVYVQGSFVYGTNLLKLPIFVKRPNWKISDDGKSVLFYDTGNWVTSNQ